MFFGLAVLIFLLLMALEIWGRSSWDNYIVKGWGLLYDVVFLGVAVSIYTAWRDKKKEVQRLREELGVVASSADEGDVFRKVRIIKRLNELKTPLPHLTAIQLPNAPLVRADFRRTELSSANLGGAVLIQAQLQGANLLKADLSGAKLGRADLQRANLYSTYLHNTDLTGANLEGANLAQAKLDGANLKLTILRGAANALLSQIQQAENWHEAELPDYIEKELEAGGYLRDRDDTLSRWYKAATHNPETDA